MEKFPLAVQDIIAKEAEYWPAIIVVRNYDAEDAEPWPTDWWQIIFNRGIGTGLIVYDVFYHGKSKNPDINHVAIVDVDSLRIVSEVA